MAILNNHYNWIHSSIKEISSGGNQAATIGYPDSLVAEDIFQNLYPDFENLPLDLRSNDIRLHHGRSEDFKVYDIIQILKKEHGFDTTVFDIDTHRGIETKIDLNYPVEEKFLRQFDCVIDASVLEHCFNIAQAFKNLCELVKLGGVVSTVNPIYMFNHGYYNINPIMLFDGFEQNGFKILYRGIMDIKGTEILSFGRKTIPIKTFNLFVAKRIEDVRFKYPIQTHKGKK